MAGDLPSYDGMAAVNVNYQEGLKMAWPKRSDPDYQACKDAYNARRRARRADPEHMARSIERWKAQKARRKKAEKK